MIAIPLNREGGEFMAKVDRLKPIPQDIAIRLCAEIRQQSAQQWYSPIARWCWLCEKMHHGDPTKMGFTRRPGNRGCTLVNAAYARQFH